MLLYLDMAETDELIELGWKLGFFGPVSNAVSTNSFQIVTYVFIVYEWKLFTDHSYFCCQNMYINDMEYFPSFWNIF